MLTGQRFRLNAALLAVEEDNDRRRVLVTLPKNATLQVKGQSSLGDPRMIDVAWHDHDCAIFAVDLEERGQHVQSGTD